MWSFLRLCETYIVYFHWTLTLAKCFLFSFTKHYLPKACIAIEDHFTLDMMHHEVGAPRTIWPMAIYLCPILCDLYTIVVSLHSMFKVPQEDDNRHSVERTTCTIAKPSDPRSWPWSREPLTYNKHLGTLIKLCTSTYHWNVGHLLDSPKNKMAQDPSPTVPHSRKLHKGTTYIELVPTVPSSLGSINSSFIIGNE